MSKLWSTEELAGAVALTPGRIRQLLQAGTLDGTKVAGTWVIPDSEAKAFIKKRKAELLEKLEQMDV
jgi:hypothetical protein